MPTCTDTKPGGAKRSRLSDVVSFETMTPSPPRHRFKPRCLAHNPEVAGSNPVPATVPATDESGPRRSLRGPLSCRPSQRRRRGRRLRRPVRPAVAERPSKATAAAVPAARAVPAVAAVADEHGVAAVPAVGGCRAVAGVAAVAAAAEDPAGAAVAAGPAGAGAGCGAAHAASTTLGEYPGAAAVAA